MKYTSEYILKLHIHQHSLNSSDVNSLRLSDHRILIFLSVWFSTKDLYSLNLLKTSLFPFNKYIQLLCEKSYIKETQYAYPFIELEYMGPHKSECTIYSIHLTFLSLLGIVFFTLFPCAHLFQMDSFFTWTFGNPKNYFLVIGRDLQCTGAGILFHS